MLRGVGLQKTSDSMRRRTEEVLLVLVETGRGCVVFGTLPGVFVGGGLRAYGFVMAFTLLAGRPMD